MGGRFETLYQLAHNLYKPGAPVVVSAGTLLKDTKTGSIIAQLKFQCMSVDTIRALKIAINAYDISGKPITGVEEYSYLDLDIQRGDFFGSDKAIVMPSRVTRSIKIEQITVISDTGLYELHGSDLQPIGSLQTLHTTLGNLDLVTQYQIDTGTTGIYAPKIIGNLWTCTCGTPNSAPVCAHCGAIREKVFGAFSPELLAQHYRLRLNAAKKEKERQAQWEEAEKERALQKEQERAAQRAEEATIQKKPILIIGIIVGCIFILAILLSVGE